MRGGGRRTVPGQGRDYVGMARREGRGEMEEAKDQTAQRLGETQETTSNNETTAHFFYRDWEIALCSTTGRKE